MKGQTSDRKKSKTGKFYKNRKRRFHPSYEISSDEHQWHSMTLTHSPEKNESYIELTKNPNPQRFQKSVSKKICCARSNSNAWGGVRKLFSFRNGSSKSQSIFGRA